jgi:glucose/arabinose dehydrogenase
MAFLPDGQILVTERPPTTNTLNPVEPGRLHIVSQSGTVSAPIIGLPQNVGLLDVKLDPEYSSNRQIYVSLMERDTTAARVGRGANNPAIDPAGLAIMKATLSFDATGVGRLFDIRLIWQQVPKIVSETGSGEPGGRMAFSPDNRYLYFTAGDRQEFEPAQDLGTTLGKIIRIFPDGRIPSDNPFVSMAGARPEIWSLGHRNSYGLAFNAAGQLWENEMGPTGGDEMNLIVRSSNYGWPKVSYGDNFVGGPVIPRPSAGDGYAMAAFTWTPVIAPSGMIFYSGNLFADWKGDAIISGLQSKGLVRMRLNGSSATEAQRINLNTRIRSVTEGPDGSVWVLEDQPSGRLVKLSPVF